jgi:DNA (cytosine-5)-methyltransferase 1
MRHGSLFSGIGGFDLASEWMGWENVFHCEWMEFPRKVLDYYWPNADSHIDICKTDFKKYANTIDILTGGFPCQPFSMAGKRKGTEDERYLWGEMLRAVQEIKPKYVIAENVFGITNIDGGMVFEKVCIDLEAEGYEVQPFILPAAAKNAPHRRDRCWFIAYRNCNGFNQRNGNDEINTSERRINAQCDIKQSDVNGNATNSTSIGLCRHSEKQRLFFETHRTSNGMAKENVTDTNGIGLWGKSDRVRRSTINGQNSATNNWSNFPTESPICSRNDGISQQLDGITFSKWRAESIKGYGNAIVPQIAFEIFKIIKIHITNNQ